MTTTSGGLGEAEVGGPTLSIVPRSGGNSVAGSIYLSGVPNGWVGNNYTDELRARGLSVPGKLLKQWDFTGGVGGPIIRDRIWYYATARDLGQHRSIPGIFPNLNAGDPTKWEYLPDTSRQARGAESFQIFSARFTIQATPKNKFNVHWDWQLPCNGASITSDDACRTQPDSDAVVGSLGPRWPDGDDVARDGAATCARWCRTARSRGRPRSPTACCSRPAWDRTSRSGDRSRRPATPRETSYASPS